MNTSERISEPARAAYIHVPFCRHRCGYCNFTLVAGRDDLIDAYLAAIERELSWLQSPREVDTLFIGGGTPTHLPPRALQRLLEVVRNRFPLADGYEFSIEANPIDLSRDKIELLREFGINRVSLGVQSFSDRKLESLERDHRRDDIIQVIEAARPHFRSLAIDLIFGVPGETLDEWQCDLHAATELPLDHVSTYGLTFEKGTSFWSRRLHGEFGSIGEEVERQMYLVAIDRLAETSFEQYEVSNFAKLGHRCRHNEIYWHCGQYYAAGPGASRFINGVRETNHRSTTTYVQRVLDGRSPTAEHECLGAEDAARERLVFGLRMRDGIDVARFERETGFDLETLAGPSFSEFVRNGLLEFTSDRSQLRLTREGLLVSDSIWPYFLRT